MTAPFTRTAKVGGIAYDVSGEGPAIVLLHPVGVDRSWWSPYVAHWASRFQVLTVDFAGHGESGRIEGAVSLADHAADVLRVLDAEGLDAAVIAGVSMGGMVAQSLAIGAPGRVRSLVLCATAGSFPDAARAAIRARGNTRREGSMSEVIDATVDRWFTPRSPGALVERCRQRLASNDWHGWSANWEAISALRHLEALSALRVPALVIAGDEDASIPVAVARQLADALRAEFHLLQGSAHFGAFEEPGRFLAVIDPFLRGLDRPS